MKRLFAAMLASGLILTELCNPLTTYATEVASETEVTESVTEDETGDVVEETTEDVAETNVEETTTSETTSEEAVSDEVVDETTTEETIDEEEVEDSEAAEEIVYEEDKTSLLYVVVLNPELEQNEEQKILLGLDTGVTYENPVLKLENKDSETYSELTEYSQEEEGMTFSGSFDDDGQYSLVSLTYETTVDGEKTYHVINFKDLGVEAGFGVEATSEFQSDAVIEDEGSESVSAEDAEFVVTDMNGDAASVNDVKEALESADESVSGISTSKANISKTINKLTGTITANAASNVVIVLDPGHGGSDAGACANGLQEKNLTLKIAKYCKKELERYAGVTVYMTRTDDTYVSLANRVAFAKKKKAKYFVSIHINSGAASATGAEVYYPNGNYNATNAANGKKLAQSIEKQLVALGLTNRGIKIRNTENGSQYPDGSVRDYYAVIAGSMEAGFPGIIVEHAFITSSDATNFLNSNAKLKKLGVADAKGIVNALGLQLKTDFDEIAISSIKAKGFNCVSLEWNEVDDADGYYIYRREEGGEYEYVGETENTFFTDTTAKTKTTYYYGVAAYNSAGQGSIQGDAMVTTGNGQVKNVEVKNAVFNGNTVSWDGLEGATGYMVYRRLGSSGSFEKLTPNGITEDEYTDNTALCGKTYQYRVRAYVVVAGKKVYGKYSSKESIKTNKRAVTYKTADTNGLHQITIKWKKISGASGYRIQRKAPGATKWTTVLTKTKALSYTDTDVLPGSTYKYRVRAYRAVNGVKYWGANKTKTVTAGKGKTKVTSVYQSEFNSITIKWKKISGAKTYTIQRREKGLISSGSWATIAKNVKGKTYTDATAACGKSYQYRVRAVGKYNGKTFSCSYSSASARVTASNGAVTAKQVTVDDSGLKVTWNALEGVTGYIVYRKKEGESKFTKVGTSNTTNYVDKTVASSVTYTYRLKAYRKLNGKTYRSSVYSNEVSQLMAYSILGESNVTTAQMVAYFNASKEAYPASVYKKYGAETIEDFCDIVYDTCEDYGVRAEVVWAQICKETGYLQFGGDVQANQCNFAGIGATGGGNPGNSFGSVEEGVTAQVQHLKLYASSDTSWSSSVKIVDPRFYPTAAGKAPYVEWLGISTNPYGTGWATAADYSESLLKMVWALRKS